MILLPQANWANANGLAVLCIIVLLVYVLWPWIEPLDRRKK